MKLIRTVLLALLLSLLIGLAIGTAIRRRVERPVRYLGATHAAPIEASRVMTDAVPGAIQSAESRDAYGAGARSALTPRPLDVADPRANVLGARQHEQEVG